jgi:hypothetical protein
MAFPVILVLLVLACGAKPPEPACPQSSEAKAPYMEKSEKEFAFYPGGQIEISAAAPGSFSITGWDKSLVRVEMEKIFYYLSPDEARAKAKAYPIRVTHTPTTAKIITAGPSPPSVTMEMNVRVFVPRDRTDLKIRMIQGDLAVESLRGFTDATLEGGDILAKDLAGYFSLKTKRGDLDIELLGPTWLGYGLWGKTDMGAVNLRLPADYSAALQLGTKMGKISVDFPEQMVEGESVPIAVMEKGKGAAVNVKVGAGGAPINVLTESGIFTFQGIKKQN